MKIVGLENCMKAFTMLLKVEELPEHLKDADIMYYMKRTCLASLALEVSLGDVAERASAMSVSEISTLIRDSVRNHLFTENDKRLYEFTYDLMVNNSSNYIEWYNIGTVALTRYKDQYMNKVRELAPSDAYLQIMHPYTGVRRDFEGKVDGLTIY